MRQKLTRRELASALAVTPALPCALSGQIASKQPAGGDASVPAEDLLRNAREQTARSSEQLSKYVVAVSVEPAFLFKP